MKFGGDAVGGTEPAVSVNVVSRDGLLEDLETRLRSCQGFAVATLNLDHVVKLRRDNAFRTAYLEHTHVTADGNPVVWLLRIAGQPAELVTGSDLVEPVAALAARCGYRVAMFGSTESSLKLAAAKLAERNPGFVPELLISPPMSFDPWGHEADAAIECIERSGAGICFVALGAPKQELFVARARRRLPKVGFLSVGAGLDFISGTQQRAPTLVRRFAAEWLWRLANDPQRLGRRYVACAMSLPRLTAVAIRSRLEDREAR